MPCRSLRVRLRWWFALLGAIWCGTPHWDAVLAGDMPLYRHALSRGDPAPFEVYCLYRQQLSEASAAIRAAVDQLSGSPPSVANLVFVAVDVEQDRELQEVPSDVREAWRQTTQQTPWYLVASPTGRRLYAGSMTVDLLEALAVSPQRTAIGDLLAAGRAGVYVLLTGDDPGANQRAVAVVRQVLGDLAAGRRTLHLPPTSSSDTPRDATVPEFGLITLSRTDPAEKWLIDCLLGLAPDLATRAEPMAFLVYGRGRATFSCLGEGICPENLEQDMAVLTGVCSGVVPEQSPGEDLLMRYDWDAVASALSQRLGADADRLGGFGDGMLFSETQSLTDNSLAPPYPSGAAAVGGERVAVADLVAPAPEPVDTAPSVRRFTAATAPRSTTPPEPARTAASSSALAGTGGDSTLLPRTDPRVQTWHATLWVGGGLAGSLAALLAATWLVLRPR